MTFANAMVEGSDLYDCNVEHGDLSVDEVLHHIEEEHQNFYAEVFIGPDKQTLALVADLMRGLLDDRKAAGGGCILSPYSFTICCHESNVVIPDSLLHGERAASLAVVPFDNFCKYFEYFWKKHYSFLGFTYGTQKRAHFTQLCKIEETHPQKLIEG